MAGWILFLMGTGLMAYLLFKPKKQDDSKVQLPAGFQQILNEHVAYYRNLSDGQKRLFEDRIRHFLSYVRIHAVKTEVDDVDKLLVACSAVIPIFGFPDWRYYNLSDVLIYPDSFQQETFKIEGPDRDVAGMVGSGTMKQMMILSRRALREGFQNETDKNNTGIHEFVHLLDKADGAVDGIPSALLGKQYTIPWINLMHQTIQDILEDKSDINAYGATNQAEFFAVVSEYFFSQPELLEKKHPELFALLGQIFHQQQPVNHK